MKRYSIGFVILLVCLSTFLFAGFRVGDEWKPIPFFGGQFHLQGMGGGWSVTEAPAVFKYKDIGDTVFLDIVMVPTATTEDSTQLIIQLPESLPAPADPWQIGQCMIWHGVNYERIPAICELYSNRAIVIYPMPGMFPNDKFPADSVAGYGVHIHLFYRVAQE